MKIGWLRKLTDWLVSRKGVFLSNWLLKTFAEATIWWPFIRDTNFYILSESSIHIPLLQIVLSPIFQSCSFQVLDYIANPLATVSELVYHHKSDHFSLPAKWTSRSTALNVSWWGIFPLPLFLRDVHKGDYSALPIHCWVTLAYSGEPCVNQAWIFFCQLIGRNANETDRGKTV